MYILENKDVFLSVVSTVPLEEKIFEELIISKQNDVAFKECILMHHGVKLMTEKVAEQICIMKLSISKDVFDAAWDNLDASKKRMLIQKSAQWIRRQRRDSQTHPIRQSAHYK